MITMHARPRQTDGHAERRADELHGNSATIRSMSVSSANETKVASRSSVEEMKDHY